MNLRVSMYLGVILLLYSNCGLTVDEVCVKGNWMCLNCEDYTEMQIRDSVYYMIETDDYFGQVLPFEYRIVKDSLFVLDETGDIRFRYLIKGCKDSLLGIWKKTEVTQWKRFESEAGISTLDGRPEEKEKYRKAFQERKAKYYHRPY